MIHKVKPLIRGLLLLIVITAVLLVADLENRIDQKKPGQAGKRIIDSLSLVIDCSFSIALIHYVDSPFSESGEKGIKDELAKLKFKKGHSYEIDTYCAHGEIVTLNSIIDAVISKGYDYIMTTSTPTLQAAVRKIKDTPVIFTIVADPVIAGAGESFTDHLPNFTGISTESDFSGMIELLKDFFPGIKKVGTIFCPSEINSVVYKDVFTDLAARDGITVVGIPAFQVSEMMDAIFTMVSEGIEAICQISDNLAGSSFATIIQEADKADIPYLGFMTGEVKHGALASVSRDFYQAGVDAVTKLKFLLQGKHPSEIPFEKVSKTIIDINEDVAAKYGVKIPESYLNPGNDDLVEIEETLLEFGLVQYNDSEMSEMARDGIIDGLAAYNLIENEHFEITIRNANSDIANLNTIIDAFKSETPDILFVTSTPTLQATIRKINNFPVLFTVVANPVIAGAGKSWTDHRDNVTGIATLGDFENMVQLLLGIFPDLQTVGTLFAPGETNSVFNLKTFKHHAEENGINVISVPINSPTDIIDAAITLTSNDIDVFCQIPDNLTASSFSGIKQVAEKTKTPLFGFITNQAQSGAILVISRDYYQAGIDVTHLAVKVLNGESPGDIPFSFVSKSELIINKEAADFYNISIPQIIIDTADIIIGEP